MRLRESPDDEDLPTINQYLVEDEKIFAGKVVASVEQPDMFPSIFEDHKDHLNGKDL